MTSRKLRPRCSLPGMWTGSRWCTRTLTWPERSSGRCSTTHSMTKSVLHLRTFFSPKSLQKLQMLMFVPMRHFQGARQTWLPRQLPRDLRQSQQEGSVWWGKDSICWFYSFRTFSFFYFFFSFRQWKDRERSLRCNNICFDCNPAYFVLYHKF